MSEKVLDPEFERELRTEPIARVRVIVRTREDPRQMAGEVAKHGLVVTHTYRLIRAIAAEGLASSVLQLAAEPWVEKIEPDREVRTMNN